MPSIPAMLIATIAERRTGRRNDVKGGAVTFNTANATAALPAAAAWGGRVQGTQGAAIITTLPFATIGMHFVWEATTAFTGDFNPQDVDIIVAPELPNLVAGDAIRLAAVVGNSVEFRCYDTGVWVVQCVRGTITDVN